MNAICSQSEVANDVISSEDVYIFQCYDWKNLWVAIFSNFGVNRNQPFMQCVDDVWST